MDDTTLRVVVLGPEFGLPSISPFGIKLLTWLRLAGIEHVVEIENNTTKGPKKKSPWIIEGDRRMGDSDLIIEHLSKKHGVDTEARLSAHDRAVGHALRRTFEAHFIFTLEHHFFVTDEGWRHTRPHFDFLPAPIRGLVARMIRGEIRKEVYTQGVGRHTPEEIDALARADLDVAEALLGDGPFLFGDEPTVTDCSLYGFLALTLWSPIESAAQAHLRASPALVAYCERMRDRLWAEETAARAA